MDSRQLNAFLIVAEELNFRRSAERLGMSQPPLTRLISQLETDLGLKLFNRNTRAVELTGAGLHLWKRGQELLKGFTELENEMRSLSKDKRQHLCFAFSFGALHSSLPRLISSFKEQFPKTEIKIIEVKQIHVKEYIAQGKVDIYFGANVFEDAYFSRTPIQTQELGLLVPKNNALAAKKKIQLLDLHGETLIYHGRHEQLGFQKEFLELLTSKRIKPRIYYKKNEESCGELVSSEKGIMLATKRSAHPHPDTRFIPFADFSPKMKLYATWSKKTPSLTRDLFLNFLETNKVPTSELDGHLT